MASPETPDRSILSPALHRSVASPSFNTSTSRKCSIRPVQPKSSPKSKRSAPPPPLVEKKPAFPVLLVDPPQRATPRSRELLARLKGQHKKTESAGDPASVRRAKMKAGPPENAGKSKFAAANGDDTPPDIDDTREEDKTEAWANCVREVLSQESQEDSLQN